jgi:hypothetical protein
MKFDARVTLAVLMAIVVQTAAALLWAGSAAARLNEVEVRLEAQRPISERLARLETQMILAQRSLDRIERRLDRRK